MASIGAEVGQKMRSAIKAKLLELNCYVDDELPDYIMVMVANKRTKSQMKEDLQLFLSDKTATFVDWLHIVLKKLKEVTVTNPEVLKKTTKRKIDTSSASLVKEKKEKKITKKIKKEQETSGGGVFKSLTDDLPINANKLSEQRKIVIMKENKTSEQVIQDSFDIPLLSEVNLSTEEELEDIKQKINSVKSRLGLLIGSGKEEDCLTLKPEPDELLPSSFIKNKTKKSKLIYINETNTNLNDNQKKPERTRITFNSDELESPVKGKSILERLGKRQLSENEDASFKRTRIDLSDFRKDENKDDRRTRRNKERSKESVLNRLGVMSKVSIPTKPPEEPEEPFKNREVPSVVKIKPRTIPVDGPKANKNLLLKAVAEAQRSIAQTPQVGHNLKPDALYTKKYREKLSEHSGKKLPEVEKNKIKKILASAPESSKDGSAEYVPTQPSKEPIPKYVPMPKSKSDSDASVENGKMKQQFIVTLDGIEKKYKALVDEENQKAPIMSRLDKRKSPSPVIFDKGASPVRSKSGIPDKLPTVHASPSVKNKERCKYWPSCRQGEKCEFVHPSANCEKFPHCKFGDKCLYLHPSCKFGSSCTRRDCVYSHAAASKALTAAPNTLQTCKYFPNCANANCPFYHPKACKFGRFCKNQGECNFSHTFVPNKGNLTWRLK